MGFSRQELEWVAIAFSSIAFRELQSGGTHPHWEGDAPQLHRDRSSNLQHPSRPHLKHLGSSVFFVISSNKLVSKHLCFPGSVACSSQLIKHGWCPRNCLMWGEKLHIFGDQKCKKYRVLREHIKGKEKPRRVELSFSQHRRQTKLSFS